MCCSLKKKELRKILLGVGVGDGITPQLYGKKTLPVVAVHVLITLIYQHPNYEHLDQGPSNGG